MPPYTNLDPLHAEFCPYIGIVPANSAVEVVEVGLVAKLIVFTHEWAQKQRSRTVWLRVRVPDTAISLRTTVGAPTVQKPLDLVSRSSLAISVSTISFFAVQTVSKAT